jgi:hypothetical protein
MSILYDGKKKLDWVSAEDMGNLTFTYPGYDTITITGSQMIAPAADFFRIWDGTKAHLVPRSFIWVEWEVPSTGVAFKF